MKLETKDFYFTEATGTFDYSEIRYTDCILKHRIGPFKEHSRIRLIVVYPDRKEMHLYSKDILQHDLVVSF